MMRDKTRKAFLDANFLLIPARFKVDVFSEMQGFGKIELCTLDVVIKELERIAKGRGKSAKDAKIALQIAKRIKIIKSKSADADIELLRLGKQGHIICTLDKELIKRLKQVGADVIALRQRKYLYML
ncbi:MAG: hypothetical protein QW561_02435 [Candidatus Aenigmatarchaeota archaeon]